MATTIQNLAIVDVETGGKDESKNPITQIAVQIVEPRKFKIIKEYTTFVKPYNDLVVEKAALEYSNITFKQVANGVEVVEMLGNLMELLSYAKGTGKGGVLPLICGHNISFDLKFLEYLFAWRNKNLYKVVDRIPIDTMKLCQQIECDNLKTDEINRYTLSACCERWNVNLKNAHNAMADVEATRQLLYKIYTNARRNETTIATATAPERNAPRARENFFFEF